MKKLLFATAIAFAAISGNKVMAQEEALNPLDTLATAVQKMQNDLDVLKRLQFSGYIQGQYQVAESAGESTFEGGNFPTNVDKRFTLRRARLKATYLTELSQFVFQIDATERGVFIRDLYAKFTEPYLKAFSLTAGCMNRPFGFEVPYSSSLRESPERGRMSQTIFPGERDLGAMITFQMPKTSKWNILKVEGGFFNGTGLGAADFDSYKDFIGNIGINRTTKSEKISYAVRASYYNGGVNQNSSTVYSMGTDSLGANVFKMNKDTSNFGAAAKRVYTGFDAQLNIDGKFGMTSLRAEFIAGEQPGTSATSTSPSAQPTEFYKRKFNGAYFYLLQNIGQSKHQFVLKYDWYDPNTQVKGDEIGQAVAPISGSSFKTTNATDVKFTTIGIGWVYHYDNNLKLTAFVDFVNNETTKNVSAYKEDLKDDVFTLRLQYKF